MAIRISGVQFGTITSAQSSLYLTDLFDVAITSPSPGNYLKYDSTLVGWKNASLDTDIFGYLDTNLTGSNGISLVKFANAVDISVALSATGDTTGTLTDGALALTLATVNSNIGTFGSVSEIPVVTVNAKGLVTGVSTASITSFVLPSTTTAGTYTSVTVDSTGIVTAGTNPTATTATTVATVTPTTVDSFSSLVYRSAKYLVQVVDATSAAYHFVEISVIHNGSTVFKTEFGEITSSGPLGTFDAAIVADTLVLLFTAIDAVSKVVTVTRTAIAA
jgi:hypothetical protein